MEVERARLTRRLAQIEEEQGNISKAAKILQDQQVETFGSMEKREKVEFILEQMRLCLANHDYVRTQIISKKISVRFFDTDGVQVSSRTVDWPIPVNEKVCIAGSEIEILSADDCIGRT